MVSRLGEKNVTCVVPGIEEGLKDLRHQQQDERDHHQDENLDDEVREKGQKETDSSARIVGGHFTGREKGRDDPWEQEKDHQAKRFFSPKGGESQVGQKGGEKGADDKGQRRQEEEKTEPTVPRKWSEATGLRRSFFDRLGRAIRIG